MTTSTETAGTAPVTVDDVRAVKTDLDALIWLRAALLCESFPWELGQWDCAARSLLEAADRRTTPATDESRDAVLEEAARQTARKTLKARYPSIHDNNFYVADVAIDAYLATLKGPRP